MSNNDVLLEVEHLKKHFRVKQGYLHAVDDISLSICRESTIGLVGESGCGKSTLGRIILRLIEPTSGKIVFDGTDILALNKREMRKKRAEMQIIFQDPFSSLNPRKTVSQTILEPIQINGLSHGKSEDSVRVKELMDLVGLAPRLANAYPHELDGGRRQRVGIARALALNPKFIVCDEPVSALDVSIQAQILNLLEELQSSLGLTYLFITHDLSVVNYISEEIIVMYLGKIVERAPTNEIFSNPTHPYTQALLSAIPEPKLSSKRHRILLTGEIVSPINPKPGCRFANRCKYATERCKQEDPELQEFEKGHYVACFMTGK